MPLARIITDVADDSLELTMQLRARGFQVETVAPGQVADTPADLEVRLDECAPEDVLSQAETSEAEDLWVFVAPGALDENVRPLRALPGMPRVSSAKTMPLVLPKPKVELPALRVALPIDSPDEDLILAELREFRLPAVVHPTAEPEQPTKAEKVSESTTPLRSEGAVLRPQVATKLEFSRPQGVGPNDQTVAKAIEKAPLRTPELPTIPIVAEPVVAFVAGPLWPVVNTQKKARRLNLRPWKVALVSMSLVLAAWILVGARRTDSAATSVRPTSRLLPSVPSIRSAQATPRPPEPRAMASAPLPKTRTPAKELPARPPRVAQTARSTKEAQHPVAHTRGDDIIAKDTVVFYDHKPSAPQAKAQVAPGVKQYTDRN
jgi:hypothetical protein